MDSELLNFLAGVVIVIVAAKVGGYLSIRIGQPSVLGELLVGILLGPTVLNMLGAWPLFAGDSHLSASLTLFAEIGVILLMFLAGLELDLGDLLRSGRVAGLAGTLGVIVPFVGGYATARLFGLDSVEAVFIGLALSATSVSISAQTLMELGVLRSKVGLGLLGAAVFDDILVVLLLSGASVVFGGGEGGILMVLVRMVLFLVGASAVGLYVVPWLMARVEGLPVSQAVPTAALVICLLFAWASEALGGMAAITGAFMAGLFFARTTYVHHIETSLAAMAYSLFVPVFLVNIGLQANLRAISGAGWYLAIALTLVAIIAKVVGSGLGALAGGFNRRDSLRLGVGMISRGEVGLIVASVALRTELIHPSTFSGIVFMVIVATLVTPPLLRLVYRDDDATPVDAGATANP
ncbi:MAG: cation:proton antiporter [Candidatus Promineofilum sp.]|nr:cation:proton antiporter [Promineifilum sp.]MCW5863758.1 cation:proton antiporter [Anaerolineae bacterium]